MNTPGAPVRRVLDRVQRRFVRWRAGSVLILVVALLVLMALIGTAYLTMAQNDRFAAQQHSYNTQIDLLVDSVVSLAKGSLSRDVIVAGQYLDPADVEDPAKPPPTSVKNYLGVGADDSATQVMSPAGSIEYHAKPTAGTWWLADRLPVIDQIGFAPTPPAGGNPPYWRFITGPLASTNFESPQWPTSTPNIFTRDLPAGAAGAGTNARWVPTVTTIGGVDHPALWMMDATGRLMGRPILAADADGDGIADAPLFKLPIGTINGLTYYAAVRIVDNLAAVNANTAMFPSPVTSPTAIAPAGDFFPSNINLYSLLTAGDSINTLNAYRFGPAGPPAAVIDENGVRRPDFQFGSPTESAWMQLGRRLQSPGFVNANTRARALGITESMKLAHKFVVLDAGIKSSVLEQVLPNSTTNLSPVQAYAPADTVRWFRENFQFNPAPGVANRVPLRSILVARNPLSSFAPNKFRRRLYPPSISDPSSRDSNLLGDLYWFGDAVTVNGRAYVYIGPRSIPFVGLSTTLPAALNNPFTPLAKWYWVAEPWSTAPTKISVNTGTFGQLYTAYWGLIHDPVNAVVDITPSDFVHTFLPPNTERRQFYSPLRDPNEVWPSQVVPDGFRQFRPVQRSWIPPQDVAKLRAALAAVNTIGLRGDHLSVVSRRILINAEVASPQINADTPAQFLRGAHFIVGFPNLPPVPTGTNSLIEATVYSTAPQPYITRIYAENDTHNLGTHGRNPQGYVGVELYNPFPFDIDLTNWNLGILQGRTKGIAPPALPPAGFQYPNMRLKPIIGFGGFSPARGAPIVPHGGYLVLENLNPAHGSGTDANSRPMIVDTPPGPGTVQYYYVPGLQQVMQSSDSPASQPGGELVLLRPRKAQLTGNTMTCTISPPNNDYDETKLIDLVPADSFDFTGMVMAPANPPPSFPFTGIYYHRTDPSAPGGAWKFTYPGHWDATGITPPAPTQPFRQEGTQKSLPWDQNSTDQRFGAPMGPVRHFGPPTDPTMPPEQAWFPNNFPPIQLSNVDMAGPLRATAATNHFPYGGFARNGDILQVPYVGAYRLRILERLPAGPGDGNPNFDIVGGTYNPKLLTGRDIDPQGSTVFELNAVTMDLQQADDYDTYPPPLVLSDDKAENVGRFCPILGSDITTNGTPPVDDFVTPPGNPNLPPPWRYHWAMQLLDYLTVDSPLDTQLCNAAPDAHTTPNPPPQGVSHTSATTVAPQTFGFIITNNPTDPLGVSASIDLLNNRPGAYANLLMMFINGQGEGQIVQIAPSGPRRVAPTQWQIPFNPVSPSLALSQLPRLTRFIAPQAGDSLVIFGNPEETTPTDGLINVNTASWRVLAAVPFVPNAMTTGAALNQLIAFSIVWYRDVDDGTRLANLPVHGHGPFTSLKELNLVPIRGTNYTLRDAMYGAGSSQIRDFTNSDGDLSPYLSAQTDGATGDFEGTFLMMNRVSNLLTTRSDSFTVYIIVQGWRDAETPNPTLAVQRRAAFLVDRSVVTPVNPLPNFTPVPTD